MDKFQSFAEVLSFHSKSHGEDCAFIFLNDGAEDEVRLTYKELHEAALNVAVHIKTFAQKGDRLLLFYPSGLEFIKAFYGCLYAGVVAVPSYPPRMNKTIDRLTSIMNDCGAKAILTSSGTVGIDKINRDTENRYLIVYTDQINNRTNDALSFSEIKKEDTAFLQYTSGSTGNPKGVVISHGNILSNQALIKEAFHQSSKSVIVGWLPFYHDMGLIGNILHPVYLGAQAVLMSPTHFLQKPLRWLQAISKYKGTTSGGPNFAYELCAKRITEKDKQELDLSCWKVAFCGAEPVRASTVESFGSHFSSCGFSMKTFQPCYGMAETTLLISAYQNESTISIRSFDHASLVFDGNEDVLIDSSSALVSCGKVTGFDLKIVGTNRQEKLNGKVGEIWVRGDSVSKGYWNKPEINKESFEAYLANGDGPYFKTGDLGVLEDDQLYIAGRLKDLIIINGRNVYPQDIEFITTQSDDSLIAGACAAFSVDSEQGAAIVVVCEIDERLKPVYASINKKIRTNLFDALEIDVKEIVFIRRHSIAKTTSGKIQRYACRALYLNHELNIVQEESSSISTAFAKMLFENEVQEKIYQIVKQITGQEISSIEDNFFSVGMDSLKITMLAMELDREFSIDFELVFEKPTIKGLSQYIQQNKPVATTSFAQKDIEGYLELSSTQMGIWLDCKLNPDTTAYNICSITELDSAIDSSLAQQALSKLVEKHSILRTSFTEINGVVYQSIQEGHVENLQTVQIESRNSKAYHNFVSSAKATVFDLEQSPLLKLYILRFQDGSADQLLILIHHIITDGTSLKMLIQDFHSICQSNNSSGSSYQFKDFSHWINEKLVSEVGQQAKTYWENELYSTPEQLNLPLKSISVEENKKGKSEILKLDKSLLDKLELVSQANKVSLFTTLLSSFLFVLHRISGEEDVVIGTPFSLRDNAESLAIQGPLVNAVFVRNIFNGQSNFEDLLASVHEKIILANKYKFYPVGKIVQGLNIKNTPGKFPISQMFFNFLNFVNEERELETFQNCEGLDINFYLNCYAVKLDNGLHLRLDYRAALFDREVVLSMLNKYKSLLYAVSEDSKISLTDIHYYTTDKLSVEANQDAVWYNEEQSLVEALSDRLVRFDASPAIVTEDIQFSYHALNAITSAIAKDLSSYAGGKAVICLSPGYQIPLAIIACLKAGITYSFLAIDSNEERIIHVLEELKPSLVLTDDSTTKILKDFSSIERKIPCMNIDGYDVKVSYATPHSTCLHPQDLLYILYTSGSTGNAKGVMQTGKGLLHYISNYSGAINILPADRISGITAASYDSFNKEFYAALLNGASYFPCDIKLLTDPLAMYNWLEGNAITVWQVSPILFRHYATHWMQNGLLLRQLRIVKMTGDAVRAADFELFKSVTIPSAEFVVSLGSTESSLYTINLFSHQDIVGSEFMPVGYPVRRTDVIIANAGYNQEIDVLEVGELYVSNPHLTLGYYSNDELTLEKFVEKEGKKFFKTGDIGRRLLNGKIEWIGRNESITKVNGNRVSLKNLDSYLAQYPFIDDSYSVIKEEGHGHIIISYVVVSSVMNYGEVKKYLSKKLPDYNISSFFIEIDKIPVNAHGKIDRKALPSIHEVEHFIETEYVLPRTSLEQRIVEIWKDILGLEDLSVKDDFFSKGGHSLKVIQLVSRIRKELEVSIDVKNVFEHNTVEKQALFMESSFSHQEEIIPQTPEQSDYELSHAQQRIWILSQFKESSLAYNMPGCLLLEGVLNVDILKASIDYLVSRHESLRTVFRENIQGEPRQFVLPIESVISSLRIEDISGLADPEIRLSELSNLEQTLAFDLSEGPLLRFKLIKLSDIRHILLFTMHHIISDGSSMEILSQEFFKVYQALLDKKLVGLPPLNIQYKDYAAWHNKQLNNNSYEAHEQYWLSQFSGDLPVLELQADKSRPAIQTHNGATKELQLGIDLIARLKASCSKEGATLFMGLLAGINTLLYKYTGQKDVVLGTPIAGRDRHELESQIGLYLNPLAIRTQFEDNNSFTDLLGIIKSVVLDAYTHMSYPFDRLVEKLNLKRDLSRSVLYDVMVILQSQQDIDRKDSVTSDGLAFKRLNRIAKNTSALDLTFDFLENDKGVLLSLNYNTDVFSETFITGFIKHFEQILNELLNQPQVEICHLDYLSKEEQFVLLETFNQTSVNFPQQQSVLDLIEYHAELDGSKVALKDNELSYTYDSLLVHARTIADEMNRLITIKQDDLVIVFMERTHLFPISILGVWETGAAYVPLDPDFPEDRIKAILKDCNPVLILSEQKLWNKHQENLNLNIPVVCVEDLLTGQLSKRNHSLKKVKADSLAYVIYTSGSTGVPKGAMVEHMGMQNHLWAKVNDLTLNKHSIVAQNASQCFDISVWQFFSAMVVGGTTVVYEDDLVLNPEKLIQQVDEDQVTVLEVVPSYLSVMLNMIALNGRHGLFQKLTYLMVTGEVVKKSLVEEWFRLFSTIPLVNAYGPTEASDDITHHFMRSVPEGDTVPIGKPVQNFHIYIVDAAGNLCARGVKGEIWVSGIGVGRGYLNDKEKTKKVFSIDPFRKEEEARLYKTGDIGRWLADGTIEFFGRKDHQVKIRGHRIELGEIEHKLIKQTGIKDAVVQDYEDTSGIRYLVGYLITEPTSSKEETLANIRQQLGKEVPDYMVPTFFVSMEEFPLTPNGKIDRKALPVPDESLVSEASNFVAPRNEVEHELLYIWKDILGKESISIHNNFFEIGGHSLKAIQLVSRIRREMQVEMNINLIFNHPTIALQSQLIGQGETLVHRRIPVSETKESYPLSFSQQRFWILSQFENSSLAYNMVGGLSLEGELNADVLKQAIQLIISRHEVLRTIFKTDKNNELIQVVLDHLPNFEIAQEDFSTSTDPYEAIARVSSEEQQHPFDLSVAPLLRVRLLRIADKKHILFFTMHHIISDGWSMEVLSKEIVLAYNSFKHGVVPILEPLRIQYKDYAVWQKELLETGVLEAQETYWLNQFEGDLPVIDLPLSNKRPLIKTYRGGSLHKSLSSSTTEKLHDFSVKEGATLFMGLMAGLSALLYRYSGQQDLIIGTPNAGRTDKDLENQIGLYLNTLGLRTTIKKEDSFSDLLHQTKEILLGAYSHQDYPFDRLIDQLNLKRDTSRSALFDIMLVFQNQSGMYSGVEKNNFEGLKASRLSGLEKQTSQFDLIFEFVQHEHELTLHLNFNKDLYSYENANQLCLHYEQLLEAVLCDVNTPIKNVNYLNAYELEELASFNDTVTDYPAVTVAQLFEEQVIHTPDALAVSVGDVQLSYTQLNECSNQLAHYIRDKFDISANSLVGIQLEKDEWLIISMLAVLKTGGAYLPLDTSYPQERLDYMVADSSCHVIIDETELTLFKAIASQKSKVNISATNTSRDLAYVMYTSGSTGKPKGVMVEQRSVVRLVKNTNYISITSTDRFLQTGSISFDAATFEIWGALLNGASLFLLTSNEFLNITKLKDSLSRHRISILWSTSSWFNELVESDITVFSDLKYLLVGGDRLSPYHINQVLDAYPQVKLINGYGPTENTTFSTCFSIDQKYSSNIPIGKPISNSKVHILGDGFQQQPIMVWGEVCLSGDGLARGYINNTTLTNERFISNPFEKDTLMYLTGDIGRWLPNGAIEYLGRKDKQIKIRGFRVELGEIENALLQYNDVNEAVVIAKEERSGTKSLIAFLVGEHIDKTSVEQYMRSLFPDYMVPALLVVLDRIPLTSNGKVDHEALASTDIVYSDDKLYVAPRSEVESLLVEMWKEILDKNQISVTDNFFSIGGHSLKAVRLSSQIRKFFEVDLSIDTIFRLTTVSEQADYIAKAEKNSQASIPQLGKQPRYEMSHAQRRFWILSQFTESSLAYNMPVVLLFEGNLNKEALEKSLQYIVNRHEILRTVFKESYEEEAYQYVQPIGQHSLLYDYSDISSWANVDSELRRLYQEEQLTPFDLTKGPLLRIRLVKVKEDCHAFYYTMHHIISDGWSSQVLAREVISAYNAYQKGLDPVLGHLEIQYKDYSAWHNQQLETDTAIEQETYWLSQFSGEIPVLNLPGKNRPAIKTHKGSSFAKTISSETLNPLKAMCGKEGATLFMGLLAGLNTLLHRYSGQEDIIIGSPIAGRQHKQLEDQIGLYLNTLALRTRFSSSDSFTQLLRSVKKVSLDAYRYQNYPFDRLIDRLNIERDMSRSALFDVLLILQNQDNMGLYDKQVGFDELRVKELENLERSTSQFDLTFNFTETDQMLQLVVTYNTDIYNKEMITQLCNHFESLLKTAVLNADEQIGSLDYISIEEKQKILFDFNQTKHDYSSKTIVELFETQVIEHADKIALVSGDIRFSYGELNAKANQLAHYLKNNFSIEQNDLIGIVADRSEWSVIGLLGILKSGAAYVPIDPELPLERNHYIIKDSGVKLLLSQFNYSFPDIDTVLLREEKFRQESVASLVDSSLINSLAYVIYTSGTTNVPKGVMIEHGSLANYSNWAAKQLRLNNESSSVLTSSFAFDLGYTSVFPVLITGGTLHLVSKAIVLSPDQLLSYIGSNRISYLKITPSLFSVLVHSDYFTGHFLPHLDTIVMGGEMINSFDLISAKEKCSHLKFMNHYGPTETTIGTIAQWIDDKNFDSFVNKPVIGSPIDNNRIYIYDRNDQLLPIGVAGEIAIAGKGVSRGYLNKSELTSEKFVQNPYVEERFYRSGDWGRWTTDGKIEIIGRQDDQLKIRGFRVETSEIIHCLKQHKNVNEAVVLPLSDGSGSKYLIAYLVGNTIDIEDLKSHLGQFLPDYMIPGYLIPVDHIPLTSNGKVDRKALLAGYPIDSLKEESYVAPRNSVEELLVNIWEDVLEKSRIGVMDNFFQLGGHSIKAIKLATRIRKEFQLNLTIDVLFRLSTIADQAKYLSGRIGREVELIIPSIEKQPAYALSHAQQRLWILSQFKESALAYHMSRSVLLTGRLEKQIIEEAMTYLVLRHESLRTVFREETDGQITQVITALENETFKVSYEDFSDLEDKEGRIAEFIERERKISFDLSEGPLLRCQLIKLEKEKHQLFFTMHHIISDGWSMEVLSKEFIHVYNKLRSGRPVELAPLRIQYKDYTAWQNSALTEERFAKMESYWVNRFEGLLPVLNLPAEHTRPSVKTHNGSFVQTVFSHSLEEKLRAFCLAESGTLFMGLMAGLNALFYRYTGQDDIIIGSPVAGRNNEDLENQIGLYLNTLALRTNFSGENSFVELFHKTESVLLDAYQYQDYPFDMLVDKLSLSRDLSRSALFDVMVILQNQRTQYAGEEYDSLDALVMKAIPDSTRTTSQFDLTFEFEENNRGIVLNLNYNTDIYSQSKAKQLSAHYIQLLDALLSASDTSIRMIDYLDAREKDQLLNSFNNTTVDYPHQKTIIDLFEEQARTTPNAIALSFEGKHLSYRELNEHANQLAHFIISQHKLESGALVGIKVERSEKMLIGLLAILKAGAAYVPLDPSYPKERLEYIVDHSQIGLLIGDVLESSYTIDQFSLSGNLMLSDMPITNPALKVPEDHLAYVIYTSGSTGKPKGVMVKHKNVTNFLCAMAKEFQLNGSDSLLAVTTYSFDIAVLELFLPILLGARVVIASKAACQDAAAIQKTLLAENITMLQATPSFWKMLLDSNWKGRNDLTALCGGEKLTLELSAQLFPIVGSLWNMYGPTETTVWSTMKKIDSSTETVSIGKPISNTQIYILDERLQPVALGVAGNLYISGDGVTKGYLNQNNLTEERFLSNPFVRNSIIYKTGDLGKWLPDGTIECLGRTDDQVKIRGFRIELGEIETAILHHETVKEGVVVAHEDADGTQYLVGYVIAEDLDVMVLRKHLSQSLPDYMIPGYFIQLKELPLTPNGKIDRRALPKPDQAIIAGSKEYIAPRNDIERQLVEIWKNVLNRSQIGVTDDFFVIGGHSLKVFLVLSRIKEQFGVSTELKNFYSNPTIENLAIEIKANQWLKNSKNVNEELEGNTTLTF